MRGFFHGNRRVREGDDWKEDVSGGNKREKGEKRGLMIGGVI